MGWEDEMFGFLEDLEAAAEAGFAADRDLEVAERAVIEYREVTWLSRVHGSPGAHVRVDVEGVGPLTGQLAASGRGWLSLQAERGYWLVNSTAVVAIQGLGDRSVPAAAEGVALGLGPGSPLRALATDGGEVVAHLRAGTHQRGRVGRVGADFCELIEESGGAVVLPWRAVAAIRSPHRVG